MLGLFTRFQRDERGSVVVFLAISVFTLIIAVGIAVDMSRAQLVRSRLISAVDAATLSAGAVSSSQTDKIEEIVLNYFNANIPSDYMGTEIPNITITVTDSGGSELDISTLQVGDDAAVIRVQAEGTVDTTFMQLVGIQTMPISTEAEVERFSGSGPTLEIALVVDNSCSMGGGTVPPCNADTSRIDALRASVNTLLTALYGSNQNPSNIRVAMVPFNQHVNQESGTSLPSAATIAEGAGFSTSANHSLPDNGMYYGHPNNTVWYDQCIADNTDPACLELILYCFANNDSTIIQGSFPTYTPNYCPANRPTVRTGFTCAQPSLNGDFYNCWPANTRASLRNITSFGESLSQLQAEVASLNPVGATNTAIGSLYGMWALDPARDGVFDHEAPAADFGDDATIKSLVILTDGINEVCSANFDTSGNPTKPDPLISDCEANLALRNQQQIDRCQEAKDLGIDNVFTITFELDDSSPENIAQKQIFQNCASQPDYYFDADDGSALAAAFLAITDTLTQQSLRLTR